MDRTIIFKTYNHLRASKLYDAKRLNKALGLALSGHLDKYYTTTNTCTCPDHEYRGSICKHILAVRLCQNIDSLTLGDRVSLLLKPEIFGCVIMLFSTKGVIYVDFVSPTGDYYSYPLDHLRIIH